MISDHDGDKNSPLNKNRLPSLQALRCFEAAARLENFSRAADELHLTHGAISRSVRTLEDDLGLALFERRSRRVFLTDAGRKLALAVRDGLALMQQATQELRASTRPARPWVLSCEPTLLMRWLIPRWPGFQSQHPDIHIHLVAGGGPFVFDDGIDLAIRRDDFAWPTSTHAETLFIERTGPVCRPDKAEPWFSTHPDATPIFHGLHAGTPRLQTRTRPSAWQEWAQQTGQPLPPGKEQVFEHFYFSLQAAVAGLGVAIGPWHLVQDDIQSGLLVAPMGFSPDNSRYCLLSATPIQAGSPQQHLLDWLRSVG